MKEAVSTPNAPAAIGPYSQAVMAGNLVFASGSIPVDPATNAMVENEIGTQAVQVFENLKAVLTAAGCTLDDVVKTTVFLSDIGNFAAVNEIYARYFSGKVLPARSAVQVAALPKGSLLEVEAIAVKG